ncbi:MAG: hypothetical protein ACRERC_20035 [Candidatus Binatia bacterium]
MLFFVTALVAAWLASGIWCAADLLARRVRTWWLTGRRVTGSAVVLGAVTIVAAGLRCLLVPPH